MKLSRNNALRLRKHADYQRVYASSRKQFSRHMAFFYSVRPQDRRSDTPGPRIGLTVGKVLGKAVDRNRIKRRLRVCLRRHAALLTSPVDIILHPRRTVLDLDFALLDQEVADLFRTVQASLAKQARNSTGPTHSPVTPPPAARSRRASPSKPTQNPS